MALFAEEFAQELPQWHLLVTAGELVLFVEIFVGQSIIALDVLQSAYREAVDIQPVEWVVAVDTLTTLIAGLVGFEACTAPVRASRLTFAVYGFLHPEASIEHHLDGDFAKSSDAHRRGNTKPPRAEGLPIHLLSSLADHFWQWGDVMVTGDSIIQVAPEGNTQLPARLLQACKCVSAAATEVAAG